MLTLVADLCPCHPFAENYAPFQSMDPRESFLTIGESVASAPGPGHYNDVITRDKTKGGVCDRVCFPLAS